MANRGTEADGQHYWKSKLAGSPQLPSIAAYTVTCCIVIDCVVRFTMLLAYVSYSLLSLRYQFSGFAFAATTCLDRRRHGQIIVSKLAVVMIWCCGGALSLAR